MHRPPARAWRPQAPLRDGDGAPRARRPVRAAPPARYEAGRPGTGQADLQHPARTAYQQAADARDSKAAFNLGCLAAREGNGSQARSWWEVSLSGNDVHLRLASAVNLATIAALRGDTARAQTLLAQAAAAGWEPALLCAASLLPVSRLLAVTQLSLLDETECLNFRGLAANADGDRHAARELWVTSRDRGDVVAGVLLHETSSS